MYGKSHLWKSVLSFKLRLCAYDYRLVVAFSVRLIKTILCMMCLSLDHVNVLKRGEHLSELELDEVHLTVNLVQCARDTPVCIVRVSLYLLKLLKASALTAFLFFLLIIIDLMTIVRVKEIVTIIISFFLLFFVRDHSLLLFFIRGYSLVGLVIFTVFEWAVSLSCAEDVTDASLVVVAGAHTVDSLVGGGQALD